MAGSPRFAHLHNHTTYSLLDGAQRLDEMCRKAADDGQSSLAITDHGNLFGVMEFAKQANKVGVKPIIGIEAYIAPGSRHDRTPRTRGGSKPYNHLILLAQNYAGYKNLIQLSSKGYLEGFYYRPRIDKELLEQHSEGLICLSACLAGEIPQFLMHEQMKEARDSAAWFRDLFGEDRYWLELQDHGIPEQRQVNEGLMKIATELKIPSVATNDCHYLLHDDHFAHDVLVCIQTGKTVNDAGRMQYSRQHYLKSQGEMSDLFSWTPESVDNSGRIADLCDFAFQPSGNHLPDFPVPDGYTLDDYFMELAWKGLDKRLPRVRADFTAGRSARSETEYRERLDRELKTICEMGFPGYFLIVWDFIRFAREQGIPVGPGRGSAAGSLVAYALQITDIDPMTYDLLFERFLNPERVSLPDIDIDFCCRRREKVIDYVTEKYGRPNVAQIITFGTMAARAVIRDVGRGLEVPYAEVDKIAKLVPAQPGQDITIEQAIREVPALKQAYENDESIGKLLDVAQRLEGLTRHASTHAAAVVIAPKAITEYAPLYKGSKDGDEITTQFAKDEIEEIGLLKMDFLGLKTLTIIDDALLSIEASGLPRPDLETLPLDDPEVFRLFSEARTSGVFQFESEGMKDILRRLKPERFEDLIALNALYRPGPIGGGLIDDFIKRRHGKIRVEYPHSLTEEILRETYGVILYQEQVMQIASRMAGYSLGQADILRRAMGKKKKSVMDEEQKKFLEGSKKKGIDSRAAKKVFELMAFFAGYGFNKSHSAAYALVAYQTAWLKSHHPLHFMSALLTTEKGTTENIVKYVHECKEMNIDVVPPDINLSGVDFSVEDGRIRFGLSAIKGVGEGVIRSLIEARDEVGEFNSPYDLCAALDSRQINKKVMEALVGAGALDPFGADRSRLEAGIEGALEYGQRQRLQLASGQVSLFEVEEGEEDEGLSLDDQLPGVETWDEKKRLQREKETLGFYVSGHPFESYRSQIAEFSSHSIAALAELEHGTEIAVGGILSEVRTRKSRKGDWWSIVQLEDLEGQIEVLVFPKTFAAVESVLEKEKPVLIGGRYETEEGRVRLIADSVLPIDELEESKAEAVRIRLDHGSLDKTLLEAMARLCRDHRGTVPLFLEIIRPGNWRVLARAESSLSLKPSSELTQAVEGLLGEGRLRYQTTRVREDRRRTSAHRNS